MHRRHFPRPRQVGVCVLLAFGLGCWTSIGANGQAIDRLAFLQLLRDDGFAALEQRLEADENGYQSFSSADPELEPKLNAWVDARPDSEAPRMARAVFYHHLAWITRGSGYARETRRERFAVMHHYPNLATTDLEAVIENNPRFGLAYGHLITIALARGDHAATDMLVRMGLEADPSSSECAIGISTAWCRGGVAGRAWRSSRTLLRR